MTEIRYKPKYFILLLKLLTALLHYSIAVFERRFTDLTPRLINICR